MMRWLSQWFTYTVVHVARDPYNGRWVVFGEWHVSRSQCYARWLWLAHVRAAVYVVWIELIGYKIEQAIWRWGVDESAHVFKPWTRPYWMLDGFLSGF